MKGDEIMSEKLKGVTTIELTDVNTGKTKVVKNINNLPKLST